MGEFIYKILTDQEWMTTLTGIRSALRPGGTLVFETRVPAARAWERWTRAATWQRTDVAGVGVGFATKDRDREVG